MSSVSKPEDVDTVKSLSVVSRCVQAENEQKLLLSHPVSVQGEESRPDRQTGTTTTSHTALTMQDGQDEGSNVQGFKISLGYGSNNGVL